MTLRRRITKPGCSAFAAVAVAVCSLSASSVRGVTIDSFQEVNLPSQYPISLNSPLSGQAEEIGLSNVFGGGRAVFVFPGFAQFPPPSGAEIQVDADVDTTAGELSVSANDDSTFRLALAWASDDLNNHVDFDLTPLNRFVIEYSATVEFELEINLANNSPGSTFPPTGAFEGTFTLPAATDGVLEIALSDIDELELDVLNSSPAKPAVFFPPLDPTSLDSILFSLLASDGGGSIVIRDVSIIPEPAGLAAILAGCPATIAGRSRRR